VEESSSSLSCISIFSQRKSRQQISSKCLLWWILSWHWRWIPCSSRFRSCFPRRFLTIFGLLEPDSWFSVGRWRWWNCQLLWCEKHLKSDSDFFCFWLLDQLFVGFPWENWFCMEEVFHWRMTSMVSWSTQRLIGDGSLIYEKRKIRK